MVAITSAERVPDDAILQARLHRSLGAIYFALGRYPEAYEAFETALSAFRTLGEDGPKWLPSLLGNLALAKMELGDLSGALADMEEAKSLSIENLGPEHPQVGYLLLNIASLLTTMDSLAAALKNLEETEKIFRKGFDDSHPNFAYVYEQRSIIATIQKEFMVAEQEILKALKLREEHLGAENVEILRTLQVLADAYIAHGTPSKIVRAEETIERVYRLTPQCAGRRVTVSTLYARIQ